MFFVGDGALLLRAVRYAISVGLTVDFVCCSDTSAIVAPLHAMQVPVAKGRSMNAALLERLCAAPSSPGFSLNNARILTDEVLARTSMFNVHNGLTQRYRGLSEICVIAALLNRETTYGVTLHEIRPRQSVDGGRVVAQQQFPLVEDDTFSSVMTKSMKACQAIFEEQLLHVVRDDVSLSEVSHRPIVYTYANIEGLLEAAPPEARRRALTLGHYERFFPKLAALRQRL